MAQISYNTSARTLHPRPNLHASTPRTDGAIDPDNDNPDDWPPIVGPDPDAPWFSCATATAICVGVALHVTQRYTIMLVALECTTLLWQTPQSIVQVLHDMICVTVTRRMYQMLLRVPNAFVYAANSVRRYARCDGGVLLPNGVVTQCAATSNTHGLTQCDGRYFCLNCHNTQRSRQRPGRVGYEVPPTGDNKHAVCGLPSLWQYMLLYISFSFYLNVEDAWTQTKQYWAFYINMGKHYWDKNISGKHYWTSGKRYWTKHTNKAVTSMLVLTAAVLLAVCVTAQSPTALSSACDAANSAAYHTINVGSVLIILVSAVAVLTRPTVTRMAVCAIVAASTAMYTPTMEQSLHGDDMNPECANWCAHNVDTRALRSAYTDMPYTSAVTFPDGVMLRDPTSASAYHTEPGISAWSKIVTLHPDTMATYTVVPDVSYLHKVTDRTQRSVKGVANATVTCVGEMLITAVDDSGNHSTVNLPDVHVCPSCPVALLGNHARDHGIYLLADRSGQFVDFGGALVPAVYQDMLLRMQVVVHSENPPPLLATGDSQIATLFNSAIATTPAEAYTVNTNRITVAEYYCGIGTASACLPGDFITSVGCDSNAEASAVFAHHQPQAEQYGDIQSAMQTPSFTTAATACDVAICGPPCNNISGLNPTRDATAPDAQLFSRTVDVIAQHRHKVAVIETSAAIHNGTNSLLLDDMYTRAASNGYTCTPVDMDPTKHGGVQTRRRPYFVLVREDVRDKLGDFPHALPTSPNPRTLRDVLEPVQDLDIRALTASQRYSLKEGYHARHGEANGAYTTASKGQHSTAYDVDGVAPTLTTTPVVIFDDRMGEFRKLSPREQLRVQGVPDSFNFPPGTTYSNATAMIGRGMDGHCISAMGRAIRDYFDGKYRVPAASAFVMTPLAAHEAHGHMDQQKSKLKNIPFPRDGCPVCPYGKIKKAPSTGTYRPKADNPLDEVYADVKVCSVADRNGILYEIGFVDSCTGMSWVYPISTPSTSEVIRVMDEMRVQEHGGRTIKKLVMDNGSCFTSAPMQAYLTAMNTLREYSAAFHQHQNGQAESLWNRLVNLCVIQMLQSPHLGMDYWTECMRHANDQVVRMPSRSHDNRSPYALFHNLQEEPTDKHLRRWGCACHVIDKHQNFEPKAIKAYLLNYSDAHFDGTYDVLCPSTKRVRKSTDVKFPDQPFLDDLRAPDSIDCTFKSANDQPAPIPQVDTPPGPLTHLVPATDLRDGDILRLGDISKCQVVHTRERCVQLHNKTYAEAQQTLVCHHSGAKHYPKKQDIKYSVANGNLTAHRAVVPDLPAALMARAAPTKVDTHANDAYVDPRTTRITYISDDIGLDIGSIAELDPFGVKHTFDVELTVDDCGQTTTTTKRFVRNDRPHAYAAAKALPTSGNLVVASHRDFQKLTEYERYPDIQKSIEAEYNRFDDRCIWELVEVPEGETLHRCLLLIKVKLRPDGTESKIKSRCVIRGDTMVQGVHYTDTFAPTTGLTSVRCLLSNAVQHGLCCKSFDAEQAFCNAYPEFDTYLAIPPGRRMQYGRNGERMGYKLNRQTYGVPNGPRRWHMCMHNWLIRYNEQHPDRPQWVQSALEPCLYHLRGEGDDERCDIAVFVDDVLATFPDTTVGHETYGDFVEAFKADYSLQDDGYTDCVEFTGMNLTWSDDRSELRIDQPKNVYGILDKYNFRDSKSSYTPALSNILLSTMDSPADGPDGDADRAYMKDKPYRAAIGDLLWISRVYRYDITYAVNACARVANNPGPKHWEAVGKVMRYLNHTRDAQLVYRRNGSAKLEINGYADSDWAPDYGTYFDNYRSTSGEIIDSNGHAVLWKSRRQDRVAQSSAEAEYYSAADASKDLIFVARIMQSIQPKHVHHVPTLYLDNKSAIQCAQNAQDNEKQRHIDLRAHFLRDSVSRNDVSLGFISGATNPADNMTKPLGDAKFRQFRDVHNLELPVYSSKVGNSMPMPSRTQPG